MAETVDRLAEMGVDGVSIASHYHSVQTLDPLSTGPLFEQFPGGCCFDPDPSTFAGTPIDPPRNEVGGELDVVRSVAEAAAARGIDVGAWTVCMHGTRLGTTNPQFRVQSAFGDTHDHALCPSNPEVRAYLAAIVRSLVNRSVSRIDLESLGFPNVLHGHGREFGHAKNHALTSATERVLLSQCGCGGCRQAAAEYPVDFEAAMEEVKTLCRESLATPRNPHPPFRQVVAESDHLDDLISFRASVVSDLVNRLAAASDTVPLNYLVADGLGHEPTDGMPVGIDFSRLPGLDSVTAICYTDDVATTRDRVEALRRAFDGPVHAAMTLDPEVTPDREQFDATTATLRDATSGELFVYNHALMTDAHFDWLGEV
ncbi:hypothetical protein [Halogeometricum sp. CBA1124]|uniref:hypothetical protein n=1 Tax=Halogeometricum sp. CBA1124 TaxID=2668071 RepID=UPI00142B79E4|nr:hypothetical protein [Halogeometricum sp. CBA1124]MUV57288.1 hypothetical protein [Halogeometricum sp. CBA1124]